jgi:hypothetical protein
LENEKLDFERKLRATETDHRDLLDKNRVNDCHVLHLQLIYCFLGTRREFD